MVKFGKLKIILCCLFLFSCNNTQPLSIMKRLVWTFACIASVQDISSDPLLLKECTRFILAAIGAHILMEDINVWGGKFQYDI